MIQKSQTGKPLTTTVCGGDLPTILPLARIDMDLQLMESMRGGWVEVASEIKGKGLYLAKRRLFYITSPFERYKPDAFKEPDDLGRSQCRPLSQTKFGNL